MRAPSRFVLIAVASAVCLLGALVFAIPKATDDVAPTATSAPASARPAGTEPADATSFAADSEPESESESEPSLTRDQSHPAPVSWSEVRQVKVRVVHADSGVAVPGATVQRSLGISWGLGTYRGEPITPELRAKARQWLEAEGDAETDARGEVGFDWPFDDIGLRASTATGLYGSESFAELGDAPLVVAVREDLRLEVLVRDRSSNAAVGDVPVILGVIDPQRSDSKLRRQRHRRTDPATGVARFEHVQEWLASAAGKGLAWVGIPVQTPQTIPVTADDARGRPVALELPDTGSLVVRAVGDRSGQAIAGLRILVLAYASEESQVPIQMGSYGSGKTDSNGELRIPHLGTGLWVSAVPWGARTDLLRTDRHEGPRFAGETREIMLTVPEDTHTLVGRLVTATGEPWRRTLVRAEVKAVGRALTPPGGLHCTTTDEGTVELELRAAWDGRGVVSFQPLPLIPGKGRQPVACRELDGTQHVDGRTDLGVLVMDTGPLLAAGRVLLAVDDSEAKAMVSVDVIDRDGAVRDLGMLAVNHRTVEGGGFSVAAAPGCDLAGCSVRIVAIGPDRQRTAVDGEIGRDDWIVRMHEPGILKGRVALSGGVTPAECSLVLRRGSTGVATAQVEPDGAFAFTGLSAGTYEFSASLRSDTLRGKERARVRVPDLVVSADATIVDPRLQAVKLGSDLPLAELQLRDVQGAAVNNQHLVQVEDRSSGRSGMALMAADGRLLLRLRLPAALRVSCPGFEPWEDEVDVGVTPIVLQRSR